MYIIDIVYNIYMYNINICLYNINSNICLYNINIYILSIIYIHNIIIYSIYTL